ncbi:DNA polymerase III subunit alpha [Secundilactobacillus folii]|uniref:DNA polymerase III subunit alpha n=1 Tax=Secundilactobacillus folii TaxID=2678357 RepID=A0A7X2XT82_9LACO|nr:DNA polymerase III subunit alpha [Secundilactobacillus folii]MTV81214.1 DNA polymerase III subunit alpha [Secundilactobacillus folii]
MGFVPLQVMSSYSLLQSTNQLDELVKTAAERGYQALALTDRNVMYGTVAFYQTCLKYHIQPVIGLTAQLAGIFATEQTFPMVLLAKNQTGYQHLMAISSFIQTRTTSEPVTVAQIQAWLSDLMVILPSESELQYWLDQGQQTNVTQLLAQLKALVDTDSLLIGVALNQSAAVRQLLTKLAADERVKLVALPEVRYLNATDRFAVSVLQAIKDGTTISNLSEAQTKTGQYWLRPASEYESLYTELGLKTAAQLTESVAAACQIELKFQRPRLPKYQTPDEQPAKQYLKAQCATGLTRRLRENQITDAAPYQKRLTHELDVIDRMGFDDYFLIVWDVMQFTKKADIQTGPGRGSAAGSLVAYVLGITDVDPLRYNLLFERFLNEERAQMPDIDLDIPDNRREEVLEYVHQTYGHERVGQIITFGTLATKQAIRDVGRVFGLRPYELNEWSKTIPNVLHVSLKEAYDQSQPLRNLVADSPLNKLLFRTASQLEGLPRHYSTHAAGIVLSDQPLTQIVPVQNGSETMLMTQYTKDYVEQVGLLKMDFLGLRNLSLLAAALKYVRVQTGKPLAISRIDLNDPATLALFQSGDTNGVFQFESSGIKNVLRRLHPDDFELVAAVNALYRPGPMENIDHFIKRRLGQEPVTYPDDSLKSILAPTYGIIVYQEQVMQVASTMGGFTLGQADLLRRAMSKKKRATMDAMQKRFIDGAVAKGHDQKVAAATFDYIDRFANYGFNRSHAVAYSKMAFELAYLKAHYPAAFFTALLNSVLNNSTKTKLYLMEAKRHDVKILAPNINASGPYFRLEKGQIRFGLASIKGMRRDMLQSIIEERKTNGAFKSFHQFLLRLDPKWLKSDLIEGLIYAGAFDGFGNNRAELIASLPEFLSSVELSGSSLDLFKALAPKIVSKPDFSLNERLAKENEYLGAYLSGHPVEQYADLARDRNTVTVADLSVNEQVSMLVYVTRIRTIRTKHGDQMAFLTASDLTGEVSITVFPNTYRQIVTWLENEQVLLVIGKTEANRGSVQVVANSVVSAAQLASKKPASASSPAARWFLRLTPDTDTSTIRDQLMRFLAENAGQTPVIIYRVADDSKRVLKRQYWLPENEQLVQPLEKILGDHNVVLQAKN